MGRCGGEESKLLVQLGCPSVDKWEHGLVGFGIFLGKGEDRYIWIKSRTDAHFGLLDHPCSLIIPSIVLVL